jgi:hypothetical protein
MEPVRREGNLNRKYHGNKRSLDWWTVDKPVDWNPRDEGKRVSLNHDYGKRDKPAGPDGAGADSGKAAGPPPAPATNPKGRSTLNQGPADSGNTRPGARPRPRRSPGLIPPRRPIRPVPERAGRPAPRAARPKRPTTRPPAPEPSAAWCSPRDSMGKGNWFPMIRLLMI